MINLFKRKKYLYILGPSGSGKTVLAKTIELANPDKFKRIVQNTTRSIRDNEKEGVDYYFTTDAAYNELSKNKQFTAQVKEQFLPGRYGTNIGSLDDEKTNIIVVSIEGLLDGINKDNTGRKTSVLIITDVENPDVERDSRDLSSEDQYDKIICHKLEEMPVYRNINFIYIKYSDLKGIRNDSKAIMSYLKANHIK